MMEFTQKRNQNRSLFVVLIFVLHSSRVFETSVLLFAGKWKIMSRFDSNPIKFDMCLPPMTMQVSSILPPSS